ncbi:rhodanese-like domain-containing protein [Egicoccus sp. AB-alg2]|uniref:rhodanese-like domain-containing protein n=1 Tax=Egicoccus sp. AB-alg2 TaxID=3242693 RepID=UPI00359E94D9
MAATAADLVADATARIRNLTPAQVEAHLLARDAILLDVREPDELAEHGRVADAVHVPRGQLEFAADPTSPLHHPALDPAWRTIVYCWLGSRSALSVLALESLGYRDVAHLDGGLRAWAAAGLPVVGLAGWHLDAAAGTTARGRSAGEGW